MPDQLQLLGTSFIGFGRGEANGHKLHSSNPATGSQISPDYHCATSEEVNEAARLAAAAFAKYRRVAEKTKAEFLRAIATNLETLVEAIVARGHEETALPQ